MKVKRYIGPTIEDALGRVKEEMGSDAIILHRRKIKSGRGIARLFGRTVYEVVAAIDQPDVKPAIKPRAADSSIGGLEAKVEELRTSLNSLMDRMQQPERPEKKKEEIPEILMPYYTLLQGNDVAPDIIDRIIGRVQKDLNPHTAYDNDYLYYKIKKEISSFFTNIKTIELETGKPSVVAFVGPTGVGKTTTLAKLAAQYSLMKGKKVGVITCDTYRIAAIDQLKTYCEIMDVPVKVIYQSEDIMEVVEEYSGKDLILIDTAGRSHRDKMRLMELNNLLKGFGKQQTFLVISATTSFKNCLDIIANYSFLEDYRILITKTDESVTNGIILNLADKMDKPLSYITTGQNVPDDIQKVDGERLASLLLSSE